MGNIPSLCLRFRIKCFCCAGPINETNDDDDDIDETDAVIKDCRELTINELLKIISMLN
jgi:hypothetical protein